MLPNMLRIEENEEILGNQLASPLMEAQLEAHGVMERRTTCF